TSPTIAPHAGSPDSHKLTSHRQSRKLRRLSAAPAADGNSHPRLFLIPPEVGMHAVPRCFSAAIAVLFTLLAASAPADDAAEPTREQLQQAADAARTAKEQAAAQFESARMDF